MNRNRGVIALLFFFASQWAVHWAIIFFFLKKHFILDAQLRAEDPTTQAEPELLLEPSWARLTARSSSLARLKYYVRTELGMARTWARSSSAQVPSREIHLPVTYISLKYNLGAQLRALLSGVWLWISLSPSPLKVSLVHTKLNRKKIGLFY